MIQIHTCPQELQLIALLFFKKFTCDVAVMREVLEDL